MFLRATACATIVTAGPTTRGNEMLRRWPPRAQAVRIAGIVTLVGGMVVFAAPSQANVTAVTGQAYGYHGYNLNLFGPQPEQGPVPVVNLTANASNSPQDGSAASGVVTADIATLFTSGQITVHSDGRTGPYGAVHSSSTVNSVDPAGDTILSASQISSTCTMQETDATTGARILSGSTTISSGTLVTDNGIDANQDGDFTDVGDQPPTITPLPTYPPPTRRSRARSAPATPPARTRTGTWPPSTSRSPMRTAR